MLCLILAESALELVPKSVQKHPSVINSAESKGRRPGELLLDRSLHHKAMLQLKEAWNRGRPDLVHFAVLEATSTPLYLSDRLQLYVHTYDDHVIEVGRRVRLPKSYTRFEGLMVKLLAEGRISSGDSTLLCAEKMGFKGLLDEIRPSLTVGFTRLGVKTTVEEAAKRLLQTDKPTVVVGGFPRGHFSRSVSSTFDLSYSISDLPLESHVVVARLLYEYEKMM